MSWIDRPRTTNKASEDSDYVLFVDESGSAELKSVRRIISKGMQPTIDEKTFVLTGILMHKENLAEIEDKINGLKLKYWKKGMFSYKDDQREVCLHSYEIRRRMGAFHESQLKDYEGFLEDLSVLMTNLDMKIISVAIDKELCSYHLKDGSHSVYYWGMALLTSRALEVAKGKFMEIIVESRGKKEDEILHKFLVTLWLDGTPQKDANLFQSITGLYFNGKWNTNKGVIRSIFGLEIADLACYPIAKRIKSNVRTRPFDAIESKIYGYPNYYGVGIIKFP